jgi:hypothetical protein
MSRSMLKSVKINEVAIRTVAVRSQSFAIRTLNFKNINQPQPLAYISY